MLDIGHGWTAVLPRSDPRRVRPFFSFVGYTFRGKSVDASQGTVGVLAQNPDWFLEHHPNVSVWNHFPSLTVPRTSSLVISRLQETCRQFTPCVTMTQ